MRITLEVDGVRELDRAFISSRGHLEDLRPVWPQVERAFQKVEDEQFKSEGAKGRSGKWKPLTRPYAEAKAKKYGARLILQREQKLVKAMTSNTSDTIVVKDKQEFGYGTSLFYMPFVHRIRPVVSLAEDQKTTITKAMQKGILAELKKDRTITRAVDITD